MTSPHKVALVTGASAGIGKATALALLKAGYRVVLTGRRIELLEKAVADSGAPAGHALAVKADVGDPASVKALFARTKEAFGRLDLLFNNAGTAAIGQVTEVDPAAWHDLFELNVHSIFYACRAAIPHMIKNGGGSIINIASVLGLVGAKNRLAYSASKGAVRMAGVLPLGAL